MFNAANNGLFMGSEEIRNKFFEYFESKGHKIVPSAPMVVKNDPTLMFTNAGMNQFKDYFLGNEDPEDPRVANSQKCLRVSGKHNDLEEVGVDTYHHTMFEMLGNWSFGDYFKKEAIEWAWELLVDVYKIDKERLYITIFEGDKEDNLPADEESRDIWKQFVPEDRILPFDKKDNFWEMGEMGPCGPSAEIHCDIRSDAERQKVDGATLVNKDHPQVIEIWNLVFIEFNRMKDRSLKNLPNKHVDTGMGLERLAVVLQGKQSNYDTDVFTPLIERCEDLSGKKYEDAAIAMRVISDHVRAISFAIADGQLPSNTGAGYVIRRILRRAVRYGYDGLGLKEPFLFRLVTVLADQMGSRFPELKKQQELIERVVKEEESSFFKTLEQGLKRIHDKCEELKGGGKQEIDGKFVFELYDTYGFPVDLTRLVVGEGFTIDEEGFQKHLNEQKDRSREATAVDTGDWVELMEDDVEEFIGYDRLEADVYITRYREVEKKGKKLYHLVFNITPFYAEGGGQVGDTGYIEADGSKTSIVDTKKENNLIIHYSNELPTDPKAKFKAVVNSGKRSSTTSNHSATHLLHEALREVLGEHVEQKGSLVNADYLRFDFSHFSKVEDEELEKIERLVNERINKNIPLDEKRGVPMDEAKEMGAMALFGEKYGDLVRVIQFGSSVELCGGTHVGSTGEIGPFKITTETSVASGVRRVEAITGNKALEFYNNNVEQLDEIKLMLKGPKDVVQAVQNLIDQNKRLSKDIEEMTRAKAKMVKQELLSKVKEVDGVNFIAEKIDLDPGAIKDMAFQMKGQLGKFFMILGSDAGGKATITVMISEDLVKEKDLHAGNIVRELAKEIKGGGGGQPFFATAGGKDPKGIESALQKAQSYL